MQPTLSSKLKYVDEKCKYLASGYIRQFESQFMISNTKHFPIDVKHLCALFYCYHCDEFDQHHAELQVSSSESDKYNDILSCPIGSNWRCAYGKHIIVPSENLNSIYKWTFKFLGTHFMTTPSIGIISINGTLPLETYCFMTCQNCDYNYYGYETAWSGLRDLKNKTKGIRYGDGDRVKNNDIIIMELNIKDKTLKYHKNGNDLGVAFKDIDVSCKYKLAISMFTRTQQFQIMDFTKEVIN